MHHVLCQQLRFAAYEHALFAGNILRCGAERIFIQRMICILKRHYAVSAQLVYNGGVAVLVAHGGKLLRCAVRGRSARQRHAEIKEALVSKPPCKAGNAWHAYAGSLGYFVDDHAHRAVRIVQDKVCNLALRRRQRHIRGAYLVICGHFLLSFSSML